MDDVIVALDGQDWDYLINLMGALSPSLCHLKIGFEAYTAFGPRIVEHAHNLGFKVFLDLKFHDIPNTVYGAVKAASEMGVWMLNFHMAGGKEMVLAAKEAANTVTTPPLLIGVTVLTSLDDQALSAAGLPQVSTLSASLCHLADDCKIDGVVCSALEAATIRQAHPSLLTVCPGIRLNIANSQDQKRVATVDFARKNGVNYMVIGRAITQSDNPTQVLETMR